MIKLAPRFWKHGRILRSGGTDNNG